MLKIFKYEFYNIIRSPTLLLYIIFFLVITNGFIWFTGNPFKTASAILTIIIFLMPVIVMIISIMDYYNSKNFMELLLSYPLKRSDVFIAKFLAQTISFFIAQSIGYLLPIIMNKWIYSYTLLLYIISLVLILIFVSLSLMFGVINDDKVVGLAFLIGFWFFSTIGYDIILIIISLSFSNYPVEKFIIFLAILNPIDTARILVVLNLDNVYLMGYTGALFKEFLNNPIGILFAIIVMCLWIIIPLFITLRIFHNKDL